MQDCQFRIVVVGAGSAGYFAASALKYNHPNIDVVIVYDPAAPSIGVGESLNWYTPTFMRDVLGQTDPLAWMLATRSTLKFGTKHMGFDGTDRPWFFSQPDYRRQPMWVTDTGESVHHVHRLKLWQNLQHQGMEGSYNSVSSSNHWHMIHNTLPIDAQGNLDAPVGYLHTYHLNSVHSGIWVHNSIGKPAGVREEFGSVQSVKKDSNGFIECLVLNTGTEVHGNLFIDCTGFAQVLARAMDFEYEDYESYWNDSAIVGPHHYVDHSQRDCYTTVAAVDHGWRFSVPMDVRSGEGYVFNSRISSVDVDRLVAEHHAVTGYHDIAHKMLRWRPGHYRKAMDKNCVLLGLSHGFVDPFDANGFSATLSHIHILTILLGQDPAYKIDWHDFYNNKVNNICNSVKFRIEVAMHLAPKNDTAYWQAMQDAGAKAHTLERLLDIMADDAREIGNNGDRDAFRYTQHTFATHADYYGIKHPQIPHEMFDSQTHLDAMTHFLQSKNQFEALAKSAMPTADFYKQHYQL